ncbi:MAG TPA: hypothetical protein VFI41_05085 [Gemmatimonadales bacterium]|nr:hypothetical protein [Gemmatimonadales bacterium]
MAGDVVKTGAAAADIWASVAEEMRRYEKLMARQQFTGRKEFLALYKQDFQFDSKPKWSEYEYKSMPGQGQWVAGDTEALDFEKAKPFIRAVIERMLDLLSSEENWTKGVTHKKGKNGEDQWCLIGAQAQALADLSLSEYQADRTVEEQRRKVLKAVELFLLKSLEEEKGFKAMPSFNDADETDFEDIRLWLKTALGAVAD